MSKASSYFTVCQTISGLAYSRFATNLRLLTVFTGFLSTSVFSMAFFVFCGVLIVCAVGRCFDSDMFLFVFCRQARATKMRISRINVLKMIIFSVFHAWDKISMEYRTMLRLQKCLWLNVHIFFVWLFVVAFFLYVKVNNYWLVLN